MPVTTSPLHIAVVGGGIGGLAAALATARAGHRVTLVERAARFGEIGAGLQLAPNASLALDELGVLPAVRTSAVAPPRLVMMDALTGDEVTSSTCAARPTPTASHTRTWSPTAPTCTPHC